MAEWCSPPAAVASRPSTGPEPHDRTAHHAKDGKNTIGDEQTAAAGRPRAIERVLTLPMRLGWAERRVVHGPLGPPCSSAPVINVYETLMKPH
jgi:hypothetical protein